MGNQLARKEGVVEPIRNVADSFLSYDRVVVTPLEATRDGRFIWQAKRLRPGERTANRVIAVFTNSFLGRQNADKLAAETTERF